MSRGDGTYWYDDDRKRWVGQIFLTRADGSTFRPKRIGKTRAEVRERLRQLEEEHESGIDVGDTTTVGELAEWWLREVAPSRPGRHGRPISEAIRAHR